MNNFLLVIAKNTKPLLPFSPNLSIYLSGNAISRPYTTKWIGLWWAFARYKGGGGDLPVCLADWYFATSTVHSWWTVITTHRWSITMSLSENCCFDSTDLLIWYENLSIFYYFPPIINDFMRKEHYQRSVLVNRLRNAILFCDVFFIQEKS